MTSTVKLCRKLVLSSNKVWWDYLFPKNPPYMKFESILFRLTLSTQRQVSFKSFLFRSYVKQAQLAVKKDCDKNLHILLLPYFLIQIMQINF